MREIYIVFCFIFFVFSAVNVNALTLTNCLSVSDSFGTLKKNKFGVKVKWNESGEDSNWMYRLVIKNDLVIFETKSANHEVEINGQLVERRYFKVVREDEAAVYAMRVPSSEDEYDKLSNEFIFVDIEQNIFVATLFRSANMKASNRATYLVNTVYSCDRENNDVISGFVR